MSIATFNATVFHSVILRKLADEILDTTRRIEGLAAEDAGLAALWHGYKQVRSCLTCRRGYGR